jgi:hypothetical protein
VRGATVVDDAGARPRHGEVPYLHGAHGGRTPASRGGGVGVGVDDPVKADDGEEYPER